MTPRRKRMTLVFGIIVGTYTSVFVASPIVLFWHNYSDAHRKTAPVVAAAPRADVIRKGSSKDAKDKVVR